MAQYSTDVKEEFMWNMEKYLTAKGIVGSPKPLSPVQEWNAALSEDCPQKVPGRVGTGSEGHSGATEIRASHTGY